MKRSIGLRRTRRCSGRLRLAKPSFDITEPSHRLLGSTDARRKIGERALIERSRLRTIRKFTHLRLQRGQPRRETRALIIARAEGAGRVNGEKQHKHHGRADGAGSGHPPVEPFGHLAPQSRQPLVHGCERRAIRAVTNW